jgi:hypothetical protein
MGIDSTPASYPNADSFHNQSWKELQIKIADRVDPLAQLARWLDERLEELERTHEDWKTRSSYKRSVGR